MSVGFLNNFYTQITESITAAGVIASIPDADYTELLVLDEDYVYCLLRDDENREIIIIDINASSSADGLSIARGQESTVARAWSRGATIAQTITADAYGDFLQIGTSRSYGYDPNGSISPDYLGEKILQSSGEDISTRWWISKNDTDKQWLQLTDTIAVDPGGGGSGGSVLEVIWTMEDWNVGETVVYDGSIYGINGEASILTTETISKDTSIYKVGTASAKLSINTGRLAFIVSNAGTTPITLSDNNLTITSWRYVPSTISPLNGIHYCQLAVWSNLAMSLRWNETDGWQNTLGYSSSAGSISGENAFATFGSWVHWAAVLDVVNKTCKLYLDGVLDITLDISAVYAPFYGDAYMYLTVEDNVSPFGTGTDIIMYYDDVRFYNYALTVAEINALPGF